MREHSFLPLTFVTSVYGMTNMPQNDPFYHFAWTTIAVCLPTYILILCLNMPGGLGWWSLAPAVIRRHTTNCLDLISHRPQWMGTDRSKDPPSPQITSQGRPAKKRTRSTEVAMGLRAATGTATIFTPTVLSPVMSRTISADEMRTDAASPTLGSIRFDFSPTSNDHRPPLDMLEEEDIGPTTPVKSNAGSTVGETLRMGEPNESATSRRHSRSKSLLEVFRRRQGERGEQMELPDLC